MTDTTTTDTAQAVIEAARALMKHVSIAAVTRAQQNYIEVSAWAGATHCLQWYEESADEFPDTFLGNIAVLSAAMEAHDEAMAESEDA